MRHAMHNNARSVSHYLRIGVIPIITFFLHLYCFFFLKLAKRAVCHAKRGLLAERKEGAALSRAGACARPSAAFQNVLTRRPGSARLRPLPSAARRAGAAARRGHARSRRPRSGRCAARAKRVLIGCAAAEDTSTMYGVGRDTQPRTPVTLESRVADGQF